MVIFLTESIKVQRKAAEIGIKRKKRTTPFYSISLVKKAAALRPIIVIVIVVNALSSCSYIGSVQCKEEGDR